MFKIAFIGQKGIPVTQGGVERHVEELSIRLARNGYEVFVYTRPQWVPKEYRKYEKVNLISLPSLRTKNFDAISHTFISTLSAIFIQKVDVIHYHGVGPSLLTWLPKLFSRKIKVVSTVHSPDWEHQKWNKFAQKMLKMGVKFACKFADETIAVSRGLQKYCLSNHNGETTYIPNGVANVVKNAPSKEKQIEILNRFDLQPNKYLLVVTRLIKHKGVHYLIDSFKTIKDNDIEGRHKDLKLVIVGSTAFTENYQKYLLRLTKGREDVIFTGIQNGVNLDTLYRNTYMYVHPSESEGLCMTILEAMAYGKSVLVSDIPENHDIIYGNSTTGAVGFDFQNKNVLDLAEKLELLLDNPELVYKVGKKAQAYVKLYYNWEEITERIEKVYKSTVSISDKLPSKIRMAFAK